MLSLPDLKPGDRVQHELLVTEVSQRTKQDGDPYWVLTLANSTGSIASEPFWTERRAEVEGLRRGHVVQVVGEVSLYRETTRQVRVTSIRVLPEGTVDIKALLPSVGSVERYWEYVDRERKKIAKPRLRAVLDLFYEDPDFRRAYEECPAAPRGHHDAIGGLLKHTSEVAYIALAIGSMCGADRELVLAGVLLHDIGKLEAYSWSGLFDHTERGRLLGHVVLGAMMLDRRLAERPCTCTDAERDILLHLILSHHGQLQFGSPVTPMMLEAEVIHWADNASAKTASMSDALVAAENFLDGGDVSKAIWQLDRRRVWRGGSDWGL